MSEEPNIGIKSLRKSTKDKTLKAEHLRDSNRQQQYRKQSRSTNKETQDASHGLSLARAAHIIGQEGGIDTDDKENVKALKQLVNQFDNLRMKDSDLNKSNDVKFENKIEKKIEEKDPISQKEEKSEKKTTEFIQSHQDELTPEIYNTCEDHFKKEETESGHTTWDARKDTKKMKEARA